MKTTLKKTLNAKYNIILCLPNYTKRITEKYYINYKMQIYTAKLHTNSISISHIHITYYTVVIDVGTIATILRMSK